MTLKKMSKNFNHPIKIAIIGFGRRGRSLFGFLRKLSDVKVVGIVDNSPIPSAPRDFFHTPNQLLRKIKPDCVVIATPPSFHTKYINYFVSKGIDVICEKPGMVTNSDIQTINNLKGKVYITYQMPYNLMIKKAFLLAKKLSIFRITASQRVNLNSSDWHFNKKYSGGGTLIDNGSHLVNLACTFFGLPKTVFSTIDFSTRVAEEQAQAILFYDNFIFEIYCDWLSARGKENKIEIYTKEKDIIFEENNYKTELYALEKSTLEDFSLLTKSNFFLKRGLERNLFIDPYNEAYSRDATENMLDAILEDISKKYSPLARRNRQIASETISVINALYRSAEIGKKVTL